ncbi:MAG: PilZ domain-containing protein [Thermodesulfovibrionales bacterium]|nr:PilZ domain-containing protein [Thermodesulfovibrionales bacterium]
MILRLTCPECKKDSFSADAEMYKPCPYCGIQFSGRYGSEKRRAYRIHKEIPCSLSHQGEHLHAWTINLSEKGLSIKIDGSRPLMVGDVMHLEVADNPLKAQVMWSFDHPKSNATMSGLRILDGAVNIFQG